MKNKILAATILFLFFAASAFGGGALYSTETGDAQIANKGVKFYSIIVMPDGFNDVTVALHDSSDTSGGHVLPTFTFAGDGGAQASPPLPEPIITNSGLYINVTTAGTVEYTVVWKWAK